MVRRRWTAWQLGLVLALGSLGLGGFAVCAHEERGKDANEYIKKLDHALKLSKDQHTQVEQILSEYQAHLQPIKDQLTALRQDKHDKIRAALGLEQQKKFDQMQEHRKESKPHKNESHGGGADQHSE